jgi:hypothetical protein
MNQIVPISSPALPALIANAGEHAAIRFSNSSRPISRNPHTRRIHAREDAAMGKPCLCAHDPAL